MKEKTDKKPAEKWIPIQGVMEILSCSERHVEILIRQGELKSMKIGKRAIRISEPSLNAFIASRIVDPEDYFAPPEEPKPGADKPKIVRSNWMLK